MYIMYMMHFHSVCDQYITSAEDCYHLGIGNPVTDYTNWETFDYIWTWFVYVICCRTANS